MILTRCPHTEKERIEFLLLVMLRFACLMATGNPMHCPRVISRLNALQQHIDTHNPSRLFRETYCKHIGQLGEHFNLQVKDKQLHVSRISPLITIRLKETTPTHIVNQKCSSQ